MKHLFLSFFLVFIFIANSQINLNTPNGSGYLSIRITSQNFQEIESEVFQMVKNDSVEKIYGIWLEGELDSLPNFLYMFENLTELEITSYKQIKFVANDSNLSNLKSLRVYSPVNEIDDELKLLTLERLYIQYFNSKHFPKAVLTCIKMKELEILNGNIQEVPQVISNLKGLKRLNLSTNKIKFLPSEIGNLQDLEVLSLNGNQLKSLPVSICKLRSLREIYVTKNPQIKISSYIIKCLKELPSFQKIFQ